MTKPLLNKTCPVCGGRSHVCRKVDLGWYCRAQGLKLDANGLDVPEPNPIDVAIGNDPELKAAALEEKLAQDAFTTAHGKWLETAQAHERAQRAMRETEGYVSPRDGRWYPGPHAKKNAKEAARLEPIKEELWKERERRGEDLIQARVNYQRAMRAAMIRHGRPALNYGDMPKSDTTHILDSTTWTD
ncbi:hypothetical protein [Amycolatopsis thermoflava]|uniref:hypothetical protein n=1 Tax=Amycolatopsis thermoflava TaxID=84480 RepID=UPI003EBFE947